MANEQELNDQVWMLEYGLTFFGSISASISHEINNVLSIINQIGGLLEDLLYANQQGQPIPEERLRMVAEKISFQSERGVGIVKRFNAFSHSIDDPVKEFDLAELITNFTAIISRLANQKKVEITNTFIPPSINIVSSPFLVQLTIYYFLKKIFQLENQGNSVEIKADGSGPQALIEIKCSVNLEPEINRDRNILNALLLKMEAEFNMQTQDKFHIFRIEFPHKVNKG